MIAVRWVLVISVISGVSLASFPEIPNSYARFSEVEEGLYRLPDDTIPISYDVTLEPDFETFEFLGEVTITILVQRETSTITLHTDDIIIVAVRVKLQNEAGDLIVTDIGEDTEYDFLTINMQNPLQPDAILEVIIIYKGFLRTDNAGFYRASYEEGGETKWFGTTQFESTAARRAFPCYDEPALKATFIIHMIRSEAYNTISNMDLIDTTPLESGKYMDTFSETVIMPTYLVAFIVSEMDSTERREGQAVYATPAHIADGRGEYGLQIGIDVLKAMADFTGFPYPLPKMDQVGIPDNWFAAGAMENWGLVTYRERYVLYKEGLSTSSEKQSVVSIIAHEFGHQWFGNLVSPLWWDYIWLNEGFATYFEHYATDQVEPDMQMMDQFVTLCNQYAMESDSLPSARAMVHHAETPTEIDNLFDRIAYEKSGSVIRMMEHFLTTEIFEHGLNIYLTEMQYSAAQPSDLWNGLQAAVDQKNPDILGEQTVEDIMETWNRQAGFPVIDVSRNGDGKIVLEQSRFFRDTATDSTESKWTVPINYATTSDPNFENTEATLWLTEASQTTEIEIAEDEGIILNKQSTGYYRVNYGELWRQVIDYMNTNTNNYNSIHKLSRSQLYDDAFSLARSGRISYNITMDLVSCLKRETEYVPLYSFFRGLTFLHPYLINSGERYDYFKEFMRETLQAAFEEVTKEELDHTSRLNRINVMTWLCRFDHEECIDSLHEKLVNLDTGADPDMQTLVYCSGLIKDEESESKWMFLYERYNGNEAESLEKTRILNALGCTGSVTQLTRWLDTIFGIDEELQIANSARSTAFSAIVGAHRFGLDTAFNYILENFEKITTSNYVGSALGTLANRLSTAEHLEQIEGLFESLTDQLQTQFNSNFQSARNTIQNNINNSNRYIGDIKLWLDEYMSSGVEEGYRLPNDTIPISYDVILEPDFESFEFLGEVTITIQVQRVTNTITLHANDIIIDSITVKDLNEVENLRVSQTKNETEYHLLMIRVQDDLQPGQILEVNIKYTGFLRTNNAGFYRASYEEDGETKWFGTTQFESTSARRAFPCYDEPALKARFTIHMIRGETYNTISNMELISSTLVENGKYMDTFNETVIMPTYLVAFVVSEMDSTERREGQAVYATPAHIADGRGEYGLEMGIEVLKAITVFTEISYPLPKMDQIGIPDDWFAAGAMENWGLVTYRERYILYKEGLSTSSEKQSVVSIIAHEFGHQWFGNLVSPLWWDYIWLNEGFATYFEHYATEQVEPGMQMMDQFVTLCNQYAMESDSLPNARAMVHHAETPQQISSLFDRIAYEKSGAVIRMMEHFLTTEIFQRGLNIYLTEMQYGAAQPSDLWNGLQAAVDEIDPDILGDHTVEDIMETWNSQAGFPVIDVSRNNDGNIVLRQSRFFRDTATDSTNSKWTVPINYATTSDPNFEDTEPTLWLTEATQTTDIEIAEEEGIILNKQSTGYYRVNYGDLWRQIIDYMSTDNYNNIHKLSRSQLYDDALNLARSGRISYNIIMDLVSCLQRETEYVPLYSFFRGLTFLYPFLVNSGESYDYFKEFMRGTLQAAYEKVTEEELEHPARLNRINVLTWLCRFDHEECINSLHQELVELDTGADPDMQTLVYCSGLIKDEESEPKWMFLYERYNGNEAESLEKARILSALGCTGSVTQLNRWLDTIFGIDEELEIDSASRSTAFSAIIGGHKFGLDTTFNYILENFEKISTSSYAGTALQTLAARLTTVEQWEQFDGLFDSLTNQLQTQFNSSFVTVRNTIQNNIDNSDRYIGDIKLWLDEYMSGGVEEGYRLPNDTIPISYDVILEPDFESFEFLGEVTITIQVQRVTNTITLHANDIIIDSITVKEPNEVENLSVSQTRNETQYHLLLIRMQKDLQPEQILEVNIKYTGFLRDNNAGFYRASYEENGETKWFGTTQFESTSARRAFPCYDEPALKARFTIHMIRGETYNSISNMELISSTLLENGKYMDTFNETVIMPTYLVAFVVSEMNSTERHEGQAVYATPAHIADGRGEYGLEMGIEVLKAITVFTEISYPLPKMDQIGIPDDWFAAGAMENWGLVTYRERYILYKEGLSTSSEKQSVVSIIAHEFGHQWFGNLVSPLWWDYIWLNEGFATYFEHYATEQVEPGMQMMDQFVTLCNQYAMESDSLPNARAMVHHAETPQQISSLFDRIAYEKSGAVIRMMEHFLTTEIFQRGLNIYLTEMQYGAAQPSDLWNGLQAAVDEIDPDILGDHTVEDIMETWNSQAGFPVIDVSRNNDGNIVLRQSRFFRDTATDSTNSKWTVPINYATTSDPNFEDTEPTLWLTEATQTTDIEIAEEEGIILNKQSTGYYRVNYGDLWRQIIDYMSTDNYNNIHKLSRSQLYDDALNLARSGRISYNIIMDLVSCLQRETEYVPLYSFFRGLTFLYPFLVNSGESYDYFKEFMRGTLQAAYEKVTEEELEHPARLNRINVLTWLCRFDHEECINSLHQELVELDTGADPDMQTLVYCSGLIKDEESEPKWMFLYERYNGNEAESLEKARILSALGCTGSVTQLNRWLDTIFGIDEELEIDSASRSTAFSAIIGGHKFGLDTTFNYILENFEKISTSSYAGTALQTLAARLTTVEQWEQFDGLFDSLTNQLQTQFNSSFVTARNTIQNNIDNSDRYIGDIKLWLDEYMSGGVEEGYRLPNDTIPISYDVILEPDFESFEFLGEVTITIQVQRVTNTITLHANDIIIDSITVKEPNEVENLSVSQTRNETQYHLLLIRMQKDLQPEQILEVNIKYTGFLRDNNAGFYRASYEENGETKWFGTTQFESTSARRAFPCYDEPALKARFTIHMIRGETYNSISNMELISSTLLENGKYMDTFNETVIMPTYLVAFVVSEMNSTERHEGQAVYATPAHIADGRGEYGLEMGIEVLKAITVFTEISYPLPKMDQIGIPDDWFAAGAMENWGLVTYRERYILHKEGLSTSSEKQSVVSIIAHEFGHQWFGNLVSPLWWDYIWLNEGFATYFEHYATEQVEPGMQMMDQFVTLCNQYAMESDSLPNARAMVHHAETPQQISSLFDRIAYEKSGAVIRMMEHFLTTQIFQRGLNIYLTEMQYSAAQPSDLWDGLQAAVNEEDTNILGDLTVEDIMETWNSQAGFPVIDVARNNDGNIVLKQSRFFRDTATDSTNSKWTVPINYATTSDPNFGDTGFTLWLTEATQTTDIEIAEDEGIILNKQSTGYYRVNYGDLWRQITDYMSTDNYNNIHKLSRSQLYDDAFNLARSGRISYNITMDLVSCLQRETEYVPLYSFFRGLTFLYPYLVNSGESYDYFKEFMRETLQAAYEKVTEEELEHPARLNRINVLTWLCRFDHEECINSLHEELVELETGADPDMQTLVYCSGLIKDEGSESKWMFLYERYNGNEAESLEKARILSALGCTGSVTQLNRWLDTIFGIDEQLEIDSASRSTAFSAIIGGHKFGLDTTFNYILENFEEMSTSSYAGTALQTLAARLTTAEQLEQFDGLFDSLTNQLQTQFNSSFVTARSTIQNNIDNSDKYIGDVKLWLDEHSNAFVFGISLPLLLAMLLAHLLT